MPQLTEDPRVRANLAIIWILAFVITLLQTASAGESIKLITNYPNYERPNKGCSAKICQSLLKIIKASRHTIDFAIYGLRGQPEILAALIEARQRGVTIRGIIDKDINNKNYYSDSYLLEKHLLNIRSDYNHDLSVLKILNNTRTHKQREKCTRPVDHIGPLQCFEGKGYASKDFITFDGDIMHNKFFIVDNHMVWTGSANISDTGTGGYNANIVALVDSPQISRFYTIEFRSMYENGMFHRSKTKLKKKDISVKVNNKIIDLFFSPQGYTMYRGVIPLIKRARKSIDVAVFFLTHRNVSTELVNAKNRGVKVRVIIDATGATNGYSKHNYLRQNGIPVKVENWGGKMHMKSALIDGIYLIMGSMNWTGAGESKNDENTMIIKNDDDGARQFKRFFESMWLSIPNQWLNEDPLPESIDSGSSCRDGIDNDFDKKVDLNDEGCSF